MATIGMDKLFYAKITEDANGEETYGVPQMLARAIKADLSIELAEAVLYADDGAAYVIKDFKTGKLSLGVDDIGITAAQDMTGAVVDDNGVLISASENEGQPLAVGFRAAKPDGRYRYFWLYRVKFGIPATNLQTKGDSITFQTPTIRRHGHAPKQAGRNAKAPMEGRSNRGRFRRGRGHDFQLVRAGLRACLHGEFGGMKMDYADYAPTADKWLHPDGSVTTFAGDAILPADPDRAAEYENRMPSAAKWLLPDGSITDALPTSGGGGGSITITSTDFDVSGGDIEIFQQDFPTIPTPPDGSLANWAATHDYKAGQLIRLRFSAMPPGTYNTGLYVVTSDVASGGNINP